MGINAALQPLEEGFRKQLYHQLFCAEETLCGLEKKKQMQREDADALFYNLHNIKNALSYIGYLHISKAVHRVESFYLKAFEENAVMVRKQDLLQITREIIGFIEAELVKIEQGIQTEQEQEKEEGVDFSQFSGQLLQMAELLALRSEKRIALSARGFRCLVPVFIFHVAVEGLLHFITNAVDHGIEPVEERKKIGKPPEGHIHIEIKKLPLEFLIAVSDDGRGIQKREIYESAKKAGHVTADFYEYADGQLFSLLLCSGVTTKKEADLFSGRGVGLAAVNQSVKKLGGFLVIDSQEGEGSTFILKIPLGGRYRN